MFRWFLMCLVKSATKYWMNILTITIAKHEIGYLNHKEEKVRYNEASHSDEAVVEILRVGGVFV